MIEFKPILNLTFQKWKFNVDTAFGRSNPPPHKPFSSQVIHTTNLRREIKDG